MTNAIQHGPQVTGEHTATCPAIGATDREQKHQMMIRI